MFGGLVGGALSLASGIFGKKSAKKQRGDIMMGFDYLKSNPLMQQAQTSGGQAMGMRSALLGLGGDRAGAEAAFEDFRNSTGYQFQMDQGMDAITGNRAAAGMLNSGATGKELTEFGQGLSSSYFKDFMNMLGQEGDAGMSSAQAIGAAGSSAGAAAAEARAKGDQDMASGIGGLVKGIGSIFGF